MWPLTYTQIGIRVTPWMASLVSSRMVVLPFPGAPQSIAGRPAVSARHTFATTSRASTSCWSARASRTGSGAPTSVSRSRTRKYSWIGTGTGPTYLLRSKAFSASCMPSSVSRYCHSDSRRPEADVVSTSLWRRSSSRASRATPGLTRIALATPTGEGMVIR
jgi:hypothetical protein